MKNPLRKRLLRELWSDFGKYAVIFLLLVGLIGFVSGFMVADGSMIQTYNEGFEKYNIEDGHFEVRKKLNAAQKKSIASFDIDLYELFYTESRLSNDTTLRIFENRTEVDKVCLMEGELPRVEDEIAIDRMYADNNGLKVGDIICEETADGSEKGTSWTITGLVALSDYSCLFEDNNDSMFDASKFGVAIVPEGGLDRLSSDDLVYSYAWKYHTAPSDETAEKEMSEDLMKQLNGEVKLQKFIPQYQNQAIHYSGDDMGGDQAMIIAFLYIVIVILAFVFAITVSNTIEKESSVIGTLWASGYTRRELIRHYMAMPVFVTAVGAVIGNIVGYTWMKQVCAAMYYGSYSLPTYETIWNGKAFLMTTIVPVLIMLVLNYGVLRAKLRLGPLAFLRGELSGKKQRKIVPLSPKIRFFRRFQIRVLFQNASSYVVLFIGILFANMLLMFGLLLPSILNHYQDTIQEKMLANYQYMLQVPLEAMDEEHKLESSLQMLLFAHAVDTDNEEAEKFSAYTLNYTAKTGKEEEIVLYGIDDESRYVSIDFSGDGVYLSSAYADKYDIEAGDVISLKEPYGDVVYEFQVDGIYDYDASLVIFMNQESLNQVFDLGDDYFCGYFSDTEITDIKEEYIGSVIDMEALTKVSRQLTISMGSMMYLVDGFSVLIFLVLIYLLTRLIIEKNTHEISMAKILGYSNGEISRLYLQSTSVVVVAFLLISLPIETWFMRWIIKLVMQNMTGWISFYMDPIIYWKMFGIGIFAYAVVAMLEYRKIRRVPMDAALKVRE